ncbi:hypothetical protein BJ508DRAFT_152040 [Ascobolus immersus RN42]|uniref:Uncharacterized protein n=1 Tax=Ascobolus immersus RN42 TaxID=1160509 RepID=A0A3N4HYE0_ASCIM|nr:hypothetical protein BJ508DRAFT_152040 [Ascobolus immersus RN42]
MTPAPVRTCPPTRILGHTHPFLSHLKHPSPSALVNNDDPGFPLFFYTRDSL